MESLQTLSPAVPVTWKRYRPDTPSLTDEIYVLSKHGLAVSEKEYWEKYYEDEFSYEWNNGYLEVKPMGGHDSMLLYIWFLDILKRFIEVNPAAKIMGLETGFTLTAGNKKSIRKPDLAVILHSNPSPFVPGDLSYSGTCDLCIEFLSYSSKAEIERDTVHKKKEYEITGVKEYYILDDRGLETAFYKLGKSGKYEKLRPVKGDIIRSKVIPGFQFRISDLYRQPSLIEMADDEIYNSYVIPFYQAEKKQAEHEKQMLLKKIKELENSIDKLQAGEK